MRSHPVFSLLLSVCFVVAAAKFVHGQDNDQLMKKIVASLEKIDSYPAAIIKGKTAFQGETRGLTHLQFRGEKMWMELDIVATADAKERKRLTASHEVMGTTGFLVTMEFDGKKFYSFDPYNLALYIRTVRRAPAKFVDCPLVPKYWLHMGLNTTQVFRKIAEPKSYETKVEKLSEGRWKLSQKNLGNQLPGGNERVGIRDRYIVVDEKCDYLVTEYFGDGFQGKLAGTMVWEKQDGNWYAKHGKQTAGGQPLAEWTIDEISFDASKCRSRFDDLETLIPFATEITHFDEKNNEVSQHFKGGEDGKAEFQLRKLALLKRQKEGF